MTPVDTFIADLKSRLRAISKTPVVSKHKEMRLGAYAANALPLKELADDLRAILGDQQVNALFDYESAPMPEPLYDHLFMTLWDSCTEAPDGSMAVDEEFIEERLRTLADAVANGAIHYRWYLRLVNIDITDAYQLAEDIMIGKVTPQIVEEMFPLNPREGLEFVPVSLASHHTKHQVVAVVSRTVTVGQMLRESSIESLKELENSLLHAFHLSGIDLKSKPTVSHAVRQSPFGNDTHHHGILGYSSKPHLLSIDELDSVKAAFTFLQQIREPAGGDPVLVSSVSRFLIAKGTEFHHPLMINRPNWDKIVDYVIAMETLFTHHNLDNPPRGEIAYRFRLNGARLMAVAGIGKVTELFKILGVLYDLRSKSVHGSSTAISDSVKDLKKAMGMDPRKTSDWDALRHISVLVEGWFHRLFPYLGSIEQKERPYEKSFGWERLPWPTDDV